MVRPRGECRILSGHRLGIGDLLPVVDHPRLGQPERCNLKTPFHYCFTVVCASSKSQVTFVCWTVAFSLSIVPPHPNILPCLPSMGNSILKIMNSKTILDLLPPTPQSLKEIIYRALMLLFKATISGKLKVTLTLGAGMQAGWYFV